MLVMSGAVLGQHAAAVGRDDRVQVGPEVRTGVLRDNRRASTGARHGDGPGLLVETGRQPGRAASRSRLPGLDPPLRRTRRRDRRDADQPKERAQSTPQPAALSKGSRHGGEVSARRTGCRAVASAVPRPASSFPRPAPLECAHASAHQPDRPHSASLHRSDNRAAPAGDGPERRRVGRTSADDAPRRSRSCSRAATRSMPASPRCWSAASSNRISTASAAKGSCSSTRSSEKQVTSVVGQGWAPKAATIDWYLERNKTLRGEGLDPVVVPGAPHAALTVLERWGTMTFEQVSRRARSSTRATGFPLRPRTAATIERQPQVHRAAGRRTRRPG